MRRGIYSIGARWLIEDDEKGHLQYSKLNRMDRELKGQKFLKDMHKLAMVIGNVVFSSTFGMSLKDSGWCRRNN